MFLTSDFCVTNKQHLFPNLKNSPSLRSEVLTPPPRFP